MTTAVPNAPSAKAAGKTGSGSDRAAMIEAINLSKFYVDVGAMFVPDGARAPGSAAVN